MNKYYILIIISLIISSCEYNLDEENYVDIEKPTTSTVTLDLSIEGDTIEIFYSKSIRFELDDENLQINKIQAFIDTALVSTNQSYISIDSRDYTPGYHDLTFKVFTSSNSGSIADYTGTEGYYFTKKYTILTEYRISQSLEFYDSITDEGFLKIEWEKCDLFNFEKYVLSGPQVGNIRLETYCKDSNFIIDSSYIGGYLGFGLYTYVVNRPNSFKNTCALNYDLPEIQFELLSIDSLRIYWTKSFNPLCRYDVNIYHSNYSKEYTTDTSIIVPNPGFDDLDVELYSYPKHLYNVSTIYKQRVFSKYSYPSYYEFGDQEMNDIGYNSFDKVLYLNSDDSIASFDLVNMKVINKVKITEDIGYVIVSCPLNSSKICIIGNKKVILYDGSELLNHIEIDITNFNVHSNLTNSNILISCSNNQVKLYDIVNQESLSLQNIEYGGYINSSKDGKYLFSKNGSYITMYEIKLGVSITFTELYTEKLTFYPSKILFNPIDSEQLLMLNRGEEAIEIRNSIDFSIHKQISLTENDITVTFRSQLHNIDPETGNILLEDNGLYFILNIESGDLMFKYYGDFFDKVWLFNNHLISEDFQMINIGDK